MRKVEMLPVESVRPNSWNVNVLREKELAKLKEEMKALGPERTQPIVVRRIGDGAWQIVDGEQRWKIAKQLGWKHIPAIEVKVDRKEAKLLCLGFNKLRGVIDFVKLSEILQTDREMVEAATRVLGRKTTETLIEAGKNLTEDAKEILQEGLQEGAVINVAKIAAVAEVPQHLQYIAAKAATTTTLGVEFVKASVEPFLKREEVEEEKVIEIRGPEEGEFIEVGEVAEVPVEEAGEVEEEVGKVEEEARREAEEEKAEEKEAEKPEEKKAKKLYMVGGKSYEVASFVKIDDPGTYLIYFDWERKRVGITRYDVEWEAYWDQMTLPKLYRREFKCPKCGTQFVEEFDAATGKFEMREKAGKAGKK